MTAILGISAFYHDSAAALVVDGQIVAAAAEERFSRKKHDARFPTQAIKFCLDQAGITADKIDFVGFHEKPLLKFDRLLETYLAFAPIGYRSFRTAMPDWLTTKLRMPRVIRRELAGAYRKRIVYCSHHQSHAASAFFPSPYEEAAILTVDGVGEWLTATLGVGRGNRIEAEHELRFPHSLGLLYSAFTSYCGFRVNDDEYKLMGLAAYGEPVYRDLILERIIDLKPDGSFRVDMQYFNYCQGLTMTSSRLAKLLGFPLRKSDDEITQHHKDLAASIQAVTEEVLLRMVRRIHASTGMKHLVMAGGVALNCVANGRIKREGPFDDIWIQPAAGDDGAALGAALFIWHQLLGKERKTALDQQPCDSGSLLGPSFDNESVLAMLNGRQALFETVSDDQELCERTAKLLADKKVVAWFQGAMEFGPRALGNRSILADPRDPTMQARLNATVKNRESFRPFAPAVLAEKADEHFEVEKGESLPYMLVTARCSSFSALPAIAHVDQSARLQTVDQDHHPLFHQLLAEFDQITNCPVLVNTSFNVRGEPIVCAPIDAYRCYLSTDIDALVIGRHVLTKQVSEGSAETLLRSSKFHERPSWLNLEVPWNPTPRILRRFANSFMIGLPLMAILFALSWTHVVALLALAISLSISARVSPRFARFVYRTLLVVTLPIVMVLSECMLAAIYYLMVTPIGIALRLSGHRGLMLAFERNAESYWQELISPPAVNQYYQQS